jgi:hypothetical protein
MLQTTVNDTLLSLLKPDIQPDPDYNYQTDSEMSSLKIDASNEYYANDAAIIAQKILNLLKIKEDTKMLQATVVSLGIFIIIIGIFMNATFNIFSIIRRRYTATLLIMISMCTSYLLYLILYCFKLSVYLKDISKYHIYDTIQEWNYGLFMCQFINGFLLTCKLISRFSILALCIKRIVTLFEAKNEDQQPKIIKIFIKLFNLPFIFILILTIWLASFLISIPVYLSYHLTEAHNSTTILCDSIYSFPDETAKYALSTFNYMIFGLILPSVLIVALIVFIFALNCVYDLSADERIKPQTNWLLVVLFLTHFITTLPTEIYKYSRLNGIKQEVLQENTSLDEVSSLIEKSILETISNPVANAKPYYYLQYLYISEFIIVPIVLLIFYILSTKRISSFCTLYVKFFDCYEKEDLLGKSRKNIKKMPVEAEDVKVSAVLDHQVTSSLLNDEQINENDEENNNVKSMTSSGRIKIIRKTSACSTNTTSSGSGFLASDLPINNKTYNYKPK